ncbi:MAG: uroporphyrinogen decarboxylase [Actinobacteria bacterium]|nr:uroporphyrinogen decarboxylase [Actinomycetota bacterium]
MRFLTACRGEAPDVVPIWFMRQAGRSLPEYRKLREDHDILTLCRTPDLATEVTLQPVRRLGVDAAILFSDIVVPLVGLGIEVEIKPKVGPVIAEPIRSVGDLERLATFEPEADVPFVLETIRLLKGELDVPLIGFAGAPFTLASYLVEGGPSKDHRVAKSFMYAEPEAWQKLMDRLAEMTLVYLRAQIDAGVDAIQLFDSWAGHLSPVDYERYVLPASEAILRGLDGTVPRIHFGVGTAQLLELMAGAGTDVMGIDWRVPLDAARTRLGDDVVLQGNLDPVACLASWDVIEEKADDVLKRLGGTRHIFNLGHGVLPETDPDNLKRLVEYVHEWTP